MKCLILSGGTPPDEALLKKHLAGTDMLIGVDGAADTLERFGIMPHVLIGDFDTAHPACVKKLEAGGADIIRLAEEKNETDTEAAVNYALRAGADDLILLGAIGSRMDHTLANIMMLIRADRAGVRCRLVDADNEMLVSDHDFCLEGIAGQTISILPLTGDLTVSATGLKYPLEELAIHFGSSRGVSNVMKGRSARICISGGYALIIKATDNA